MNGKSEAKFHLLDQIEKKRWAQNNLALTKNYVKLFHKDLAKTQNHEN